MADEIITPVVDSTTTTEQEVQNVENAPSKEMTEQERIDAIIEKRLAREREKFQKELAEKERLAKLSEEERRVEEQKKYETELSEKETRLKLMENKLTYTKKFEEAGLPVEMLDYIAHPDADEMEVKFQEFAKKWNDNLNKKLEERVKPKDNPTAFNVNSTKPSTLRSTL